VSEETNSGAADDGADLSALWRILDDHDRTAWEQHLPELRRFLRDDTEQPDPVPESHAPGDVAAGAVGAYIERLHSDPTYEEQEGSQRLWLRKWLAPGVFILGAGWLLFVAAAILMDSANRTIAVTWDLDRDWPLMGLSTRFTDLPFDMSDTIGRWLIGSTIPNVLGGVYIVLRHLFPQDRS